MGKVEKIVVLSVLFVIVLILVLSDPGQSSAAETALAGAPGESIDEGDTLQASRTLARGGVEASEVEEEPVGQQADAVGDQPAPDGGSSGLLVAVQRVEPVYVLPDAIPKDWALITLAGLADHIFDPTHKVYEVKEGETLVGLAERYYGDASYARLLRRANEGQNELGLGQQLLVPTHDDGVSGEPVAPAPIPAGAVTYVALDGESLWVIAKKSYGKGHLWPRIWEANKDRLENPDFVPEGVTLVIPQSN